MPVLVPASWVTVNLIHLIWCLEPEDELALLLQNESNELASTDPYANNDAEVLLLEGFFNEMERWIRSCLLRASVLMLCSLVRVYDMTYFVIYLTYHHWIKKNIYSFGIHCCPIAARHQLLSIQNRLKILWAMLMLWLQHSMGMMRVRRTDYTYFLKLFYVVYGYCLHGVTFAFDAWSIKNRRFPLRWRSL